MNTTARYALGGAAIVLMLAGAIWWILVSIEPATYAAINDDVTVVLEWMLYAAAVGQTLFVGLWFSLPWYTHWVGRALMVKSVALATYLDFAVVLYHVSPFAALPTLSAILFGFITVGIWSQLVVIAYERWRTRRRQSSVTTEG